MRPAALTCVTRDERLTQVILATKMGRIFPLWGIIDDPRGLRCECRLGFLCEHQGKHPRNSPYDRASSNPEQIISWHMIYPHANYGVKIYEAVVCLDLDYRPDEQKYGPADIELLAEWYG